jgi:hypothetical protein
VRLAIVFLQKQVLCDVKYEMRELFAKVSLTSERDSLAIYFINQIFKYKTKAGR